MSPNPTFPSHAVRRSSLWLLAVSGLLLLLLILTQAVAVAGRVRLAQAGQPLVEALLLRQRTGDLPGGPGAPGIYALGRAAGEGAGSAAVRRVEIDRGLRVAAAALAGAPGGQRLEGIALGSLGQAAAAEEALRVAATQEDIFARLALGNVLDAQGQLEAARSLWQPVRAERALSLQLYRAGTALAHQNQRDQAEALLLKAIAIDPTYANAYHALGGFYWGPDRARSLEMYQAALAAGGLEPFFERFAAGRVAFIEGRMEEAATALEEAVALQPDHGDAVVLLGTTLSRLGRLEEAISFLEDAAQRSPRAFWPLVELGRIYIDLGDYDQAIETLSMAASRRADVAQPFELLAVAYQSTGQMEQAINAWQQAVTVNPGNALLHVQLGDALAEAGRPEQAIAAYRAALAINPGNGRARDGLLILGEEP
jgi:tetratricopeptide (TPR) repeat protein